MPIVWFGKSRCFKVINWVKECDYYYYFFYPRCFGPMLQHSWHQLLFAVITLMVLWLLLQHHRWVRLFICLFLAALPGGEDGSPDAPHARTGRNVHQCRHHDHCSCLTGQSVNNVVQCIVSSLHRPLNLWPLPLAGQRPLDELHQHAVDLRVRRLLRGGSRTHPLVLRSRAVLSGSKAGCYGRGRLLQLDRQLHHRHGLPICRCEYFLLQCFSLTTINNDASWLWISSRPPPGSLRAVCLPNLRSAPPLLPHLHILPSARDTGKDLRPDFSKLPPAFGGRNDGYGHEHGHGHGQAEHWVGLLGGRKYELKSPCLLRRLNPAWAELCTWAWRQVFIDMYIEVCLYIHTSCGARAVFWVFVELSFAGTTTVQG